MVDLQPVTRTTLAEAVLAQLRQQVLSGGLVPGARLPTERELCAAFRVGRTTVREALQGLVAGGFAERRGPHLVARDPRGLSPAAVDAAALAARVSVREIYETRKLLEVRATALAAEHADERDYAHLDAILAEMQDADEQRFPALDIAFHSAVVRATRNRVLAQVYEHTQHLFFPAPTFWQVFRGPQVLVARRRAFTAAVEGHARILAALRARDPDAASASARAHLEAVERQLLRRLGSTDAEINAPQAPTAGDGSGPSPIAAGRCGLTKED